MISLAEENLKENEEIVCKDAIVVCDDKGEMAWYDTNRTVYVYKEKR